MAELNIFHYFPGRSWLHKTDGRIKLVCMIIFTITISFAGEVQLTILTLGLAAALVGSRLPVHRLVSEIKYFLFFLIIVMAFHTWSVPGTPILHLPIPGATWEGLRSGLRFGWRLLLIIGTCAILTGTTSLSALKNVVEWFLRPVPFIREARVATMFSLTFVLLPLIFDQAAEISDAQKARGIENCKNPLRRIGFLTLPLLVHTFRRADEMVLAMESRCYSEERTPPDFKTNMKDWLLLGLTGLICGVQLGIKLL
jgi:energy-coupling factor transporter transmembrane protein EcfT